MKSTRNKTIVLSEQERNEELKKCIPYADFDDNSLNCVVRGDIVKCAKKLKKESVDLLVVDPPYNMTKNFGGYKFGKKSDTDYADFTRKWIEALLPSLKKTASVYVCCDWFSALVIGEVLNEHFILRNRITWQREKGRGAKANWKNGMEDIFFATVGKNYKFNLDAVKQKKKVIYMMK